MATVTPTLTLSSSDLLSDALSISTTTSITASHTSGLARAAITSTAKGTASGQVTIATAGEFTSPNYLFIKNTAAYHATNNIITLFDDANAIAPPDPPSPIIIAKVGTFNFIQHSIDFAIASACPLSSAPTPG